MQAEFEEKTYEKYFGRELADTWQTFSPGQVLESILGFDDAFFVPHRSLFLPKFGKMRGIVIREIESILRIASGRLPRFKLNLFVQYKRPEYISSHAASEWSSWGCEYFRYAVVPHQQLALEKLQQFSGARAKAIYASPAFWKSDDLYKYAKHGKICDNSNIAEALKLTGHKRYTYTKPGPTGKRHSEPSDVTSSKLGELIRLGLGENEALPLNRHLDLARGYVSEVIHANNELNGRFLNAREAMRSPFLDELSPDLPIMSAILDIVAFCDVIAASYYALSDEGGK